MSAPKTNRMSAMSMMLRRPRASARMPVSGEARSAKKDVDDVMRDLSRVVSGRWERDEFIEMRVEEITPVLRVQSQYKFQYTFKTAKAGAWWFAHRKNVLISKQ